MKKAVVRGAIASLAIAIAIGVIVASAYRSDPASASRDSVDIEFGSRYSASDLGSDGRFNRNNEQWPPAPDGAGPLFEVVSSNAEATERARLDYPAVLDADEAASKELGENYTIVNVIDPLDDGKGNLIYGAAQLDIFSRTNNQTVIVNFSGGLVSRVQTFEPTEYQPALHDDEVKESIEIAKNYWLEQGETRVEDPLQGFAIRAFDSNRNFYDGRMAYVTFHANEDVPPSLRTLVNLTNGEISEAQVIN